MANCESNAISGPGAGGSTASVKTAEQLDEYFLGCPRWLHDNSGCNFLIKLKSAAQISSVLNSEVQKGVLQVSG